MLFLFVSVQWTHVKNTQFDYTLNTGIINSALDYENKLMRKLAVIDLTHTTCAERQLNSAVELISYPRKTNPTVNIFNFNFKLLSEVT